VLECLQSALDAAVWPPNRWSQLEGSGVDWPPVEVIGHATTATALRAPGAVASLCPPIRGFELADFDLAEDVFQLSRVEHSRRPHVQQRG
jgi:hypothetical protein